MISSKVALNKRILKVFEKRVLIAHLYIPLNKHVSIVKILRSFDIVLALFFHIGGLDIRIDSQLQILPFVGLKK